MHRGGGDAENGIKETRCDFGFDPFHPKGFCATEAALTLAMIAYDLTSVFSVLALREKTRKRLSALRFRAFAIGARLQKIKYYGLEIHRFNIE
jgi:hypothetical protein